MWRTLGLLVCWLATVVRTLTFDGVRSSATATASSVIASKFSFVIRTRQTNAFVMSAQRSDDSEHFKVSLVNGTLWFNAKYLGGIQARQSGNIEVDKGDFTTVSLKRISANKTEITIGSHTLESDHDLLSARWKTLLAGGTLFIIGKDNSNLEPAFRGCLSDIKVSDVPLTQVGVNTKEDCVSESGCTVSTCQNGGKCEDIFNDYKCNCMEFYTTKNCNATVNVTCEFATYLCKNGATCRTLVQGAPRKYSDTGNDFFKCDCLPGYEGYLCEKETNECASEPCKNGGVCTDLNQDYDCNCIEGFTGKTCSTNIDDCMPNPCSCNRTCVDLVGNYTCKCDPGFEGQNCTQNINECDMGICLNNGSCVDTVGSFNCTCIGEYFGDRCQFDNTDLCEQNNPCKRAATCRDGPAGANCTCTEGFTGAYCEHDVNECATRPCKNNATCEDSHTRNDSRAGFVCLCVDGYTGPTCASPAKQTGDGDDDNKTIIIVGVVVGVVILILLILAALLYRYCKDRSGMEGTYSPNSAEQQNGQVEMNTLEKPKAERLI